MSGIGRIPGTPVDVDPGAVTPGTDPVATDPATQPVQPRPTTPGTGRHTVATTVTSTPNGGDIVPASILTKYGLDPQKPSTDSKYEGDRWSVGYYPYDGDIQYVAFGKHREIFKNTGAQEDAHGYWEAYSNPPSDLAPGSWIASGTISEDGFEAATGIDVTGDRPIDNAAYKLMREAGAPASASFALRDASGKQLPVRSDDALVPTILDRRVVPGSTDTSAKFVEVEVRGDGAYYKKGTNQSVSENVTWRLKGKDGAIRGAATDKVEDRAALAGAKSDVKFDFLDAAGEPIAYNPGWQGDRIVATFMDGDKWHTLVPKKNAQGTVTGYEHQTLDAEGKNVTATEQVDVARAEALKQGKDVIHRIQQRSGALKGDGKVGNSYDMGWWGKCHNVAAIGASSVKLPQQDVKVVTNAGSSDRVGLEWKEGTTRHLLVPVRDRDGQVTAYTHKQGTLRAQRISVDEATRLAAAHADASPVVVSRWGRVRPAEVTTVNKSEVTAMVAHMGDGAVEYKGSVGARFYGYADQIQLKDGSSKSAFITSVELDSGKKVEVGSKYGTGDYDEGDRSVLRGPGLDSRRVNSGGRQLGWSSMDFAKLQESKTDKIKNVTVQFPDGRTETIPADKVKSLGWENKWDVSPTDLWSMHAKVGAKGSSVIEKDPGTHVWNYTIENMSTKPLRKEDLPSYMRDNVGKPGMMSGSSGDEGKHFFKTNINGSDFYYWAKFDAQGNMKDYAYLSDGIPDFFWTQHVKDPFANQWTGEAQAPGARMEDIQKLYLASIGAMKKYEGPGGLVTLADLGRKPVQP